MRLLNEAHLFMLFVAMSGLIKGLKGIYLIGTVGTGEIASGLALRPLVCIFNIKINTLYTKGVCDIPNSVGLGNI